MQQRLSRTDSSILQRLAGFEKNKIPGLSQGISKELLKLQ